MAERTLCVTGAGGFLASWVVKILLSKGYAVHGTVRDPSDAKYALIPQPSFPHPQLLTQMSADIYRRVGRGGAGNWYNASDVAEADKASAASDPTPMPSSSSSPQAVDLESQTSRQGYYYQRGGGSGGRGGAGNFSLASSTDVLRREEAERTRNTLTKRPPRPAPLTGRGGAGNWNDSSVLREEEEEREAQRKREELDRKVLEHVDVGLARPGRVRVHEAKGQQGGMEEIGLT